MARDPLGQDSIAATRPFTEGHVRRRVGRHPHITLRDEVEVRGLETSDDRRRVCGVRVAPRAAGDDPDAEEALTADLVVDCSGRRSRTPQWLAELGYTPPDVEERPKH